MTHSPVRVTINNLVSRLVGGTENLGWSPSINLIASGNLVDPGGGPGSSFGGGTPNGGAPGGSSIAINLMTVNN